MATWHARQKSQVLMSFGPLVKPPVQIDRHPSRYCTHLSDFSRACLSNVCKRSIRMDGPQTLGQATNG